MSATTAGGPPTKPGGGVDLRKTVKQIAPHTLFSSKWFAMLGSLQHVTDAAVVEQKSRSEGEDKEGESLKTLWERNEMTIRYLLEEGKLNLSLRLMVDFKQMQRKEMFADALAAAKAAEPTHTFDDLPTIKVKAALYEQCLGVLLSCSFHSVESLQTLDMSSLFEHIGQTLTFALSHSEMPRSPDADRRQEILCLHYLAAMFDKIERLQEDRIMDLVMEHIITELVIKNITAYHAIYSVNTKKQAASALSGIMSTEAYRSSPDDFIPNLDSKKELVALEASFLKDEFPDYNAKKQIRPLLDAIGKIKYKI